MPVKNILFDLDGTLLPMDADRFIHAYLKRLSAYMVPYGYEPESFAKALWAGIGAMMHNDRTRTNEAAFWDVFSATLGKDTLRDQDVFEQFYLTEFQQVQHDCGYTPRAAQLLAHLRAKGLRLILATNPVFPAVATHSRIRWAGMKVEDFDYITTYENSSCCKPNPAYFEEIMEKIGCSADECVMIGNDAEEDMAAAKLGIPTFLLTDCLINRVDAPLSNWPHGGFDELQHWLDKL